MSPLYRPVPVHFFATSASDQQTRHIGPLFSLPMPFPGNVTKSCLLSIVPDPQCCPTSQQSRSLLAYPVAVANHHTLSNQIDSRPITFCRRQAHNLVMGNCMPWMDCVYRLHSDSLIALYRHLHEHPCKL